MVRRPLRGRRPRTAVRGVFITPVSALVCGRQISSHVSPTFLRLRPEAEAH
jgi:hypothetical protein